MEIVIGACRSSRCCVNRSASAFVAAIGLPDDPGGIPAGRLV
jgi:hypothetical protein